MKGGIKLSDLKYQIIKEVGDITQNKKVRVVKWGNNEDKYDIRYWSNSDEPRKGIALTKDELFKLKEIIDHELCS